MTERQWWGANGVVLLVALLLGFAQRQAQPDHATDPLQQATNAMVLRLRAATRASQQTCTMLDALHEQCRARHQHLCRVAPVPWRPLSAPSHSAQ